MKAITAKPLRARRNRIREGSRLVTFLLYAIVTAACLVTLYPFYYVLIQSFADPREVVSGTLYLWPKNYYFGSYQMILNDQKMWQAYGYTLLYVVAGTLLNLVMSVLGAYPLSVKGLIGHKALATYVLIPMYFGGGLIPTFILITQLKLYNNVFAMIIPSAVSIWNIIMVRTFFMTVPDSLKESAVIDGAGHLRTIWSIMVPLSKPVLAVISIYTIVGIWNSWFHALLYLPNAELHPLQFYLYRVMIQQTVDMSKLATMLDVESAYQRVLQNFQFKYALIIFTTLPIVFTYPFFQKYFVKGVMLGSLKG